MSKYKHINLEIKDKVAYVSFNRPDKANSLNRQGWIEMKAVFEALHQTAEARAIVFYGEGKHFCAGIDLEYLMDISGFSGEGCEGRKREKLREHIFHLQDCITAIEKCRKPVLAAIHGACVGGGVDIIAACDMRYASEDAYFCIKEIDLGLVADIGTMQRLPHILNPGIMAELSYTGRKVHGKEAKEIGLVNAVCESKEALLEHVSGIAKLIASKSPLTVRGTKEMLLYTRDHTVAESLNYMTAWNASMLFSKDLTESFQAYMMKKTPVYED